MFAEEVLSQHEGRSLITVIANHENDCRRPDLDGKKFTSASIYSVLITSHSYIRLSDLANHGLLCLDFSSFLSLSWNIILYMYALCYACYAIKSVELSAQIKKKHTFLFATFSVEHAEYCELAKNRKHKTMPNNPCGNMISKSRASSISMGNMQSVVYGWPLPVYVPLAKIWPILPRKERLEREPFGQSFIGGKRKAHYILHVSHNEHLQCNGSQF